MGKPMGIGCGQGDGSSRGLAVKRKIKRIRGHKGRDVSAPDVRRGGVNGPVER